MVSRCAVCFSPTRFKCRCRMSCASRTIWREIVGWSSMRFCSMVGGTECQNTIRILKMKFIFSGSEATYTLRRSPQSHALEYNRSVLMSTFSDVSAPPARPSPILRVLFLLAVAIALILILAVGYLYFVAHSALPQLDGKLQVSGLAAAVTVTRDSHGVPVIEAANLPDLFFAQGYVTAQDRLWQMDIMRRFAGGDLSEILGDETLKLDREQRILGLQATAKKSLDMAPVRDRTFFEAYARGVNAYI